MFRVSLLRCTTYWKALAEATQYDVCVIGAGPAGIAAALRAVDYNKRVCLIEAKRVGGTDFWSGALPSKTMWEFSRFRARLGGPQAKRLYGQSVLDCVEVDEASMRGTLFDISSTLEKQTLTALDATKKVDLLYGQATFLNDKEVQVFNHEKKEYGKVTADYYVIATGSKPRPHPFVQADGKLVMTSDHIMSAPLPKSLVVIGAGVVGCEFANIFAGLGKTKVSIVDKKAKVFPGEDTDIMEFVEKQMINAGVTIHHDSLLYDIQPWEETPEEAVKTHPENPEPQMGVQYTIKNSRTQKLTSFNVDRALLAIGRVANFDGLGLENTSLPVVDGKLQTTDLGRCIGSPNFFAVGDCNTDSYVVTFAEMRGIMAIDSVYGASKYDPKRVSETISSGAYLSRAVVGVGLNEIQCQERNISYICCTYGYDLVSRAVAAGATDGFIKILVTNDASLTILGVRGSGLSINTIVDLGALAILRHQTAYDLADRLTAYPSVAQAFQECLHAILGRSLLKPGISPSLQIRKWSPENFDRGEAYQEEVKKEGPRVRSSCTGVSTKTSPMANNRQCAPEAAPTPAAPQRQPTHEERAAPEAQRDEEKGKKIEAEAANESVLSAGTSQKEMPGQTIADIKHDEKSTGPKEEVKRVGEKEMSAGKVSTPSSTVVDMNTTSFNALPKLNRDTVIHEVGKFFHKYSPPSV